MTDAKGVIWIPRPAPVPASYVTPFEAAGFTVWLEPLMHIQPIAAPAKIETYAAQLNLLDQQHIVIFISANAVHQFFAVATREHQHMLKQVELFAVGEATAAALSERGYKAHHPVKLMSSEGLLLLPELQAVTNKRVYIARGIGGRGFLQQQLEARGAIAEHVELYERSRPEALSADLIELVESQRLTAIIVGSAETFDNLRQLLPDVSTDMNLLVPSERVAEHIRRYGFTRVINAASAASSDMIETLKTIYTA